MRLNGAVEAHRRHTLAMRPLFERPDACLVITNRKTVRLVCLKLAKEDVTSGPAVYAVA
jgi:hypothetical protein